MQKLFGTDGIRGTANVYPMTTEIAMQVGRAMAYLVRKEKKRHRIVIGKDTRLSCYMLENALAAGICSMGVDVLLVGPMPTPGIGFITTSMRADAGVVISASHNPFQDNGIKIFARDGFKLPDSKERIIEELIVENRMASLCPVADEVGRAQRIDDAKGRYIVFLKNTFPSHSTLDDFHVVLDCAHGATYRVAPHVYEELGAKVTLIGDEPDGKNINDGCGALYPQRLAARVKEEGADIGLALDGDGDRLIVADEKGSIVDGDHIMAICAKDLLQRRKLKKKTLVTTVMSNMGLAVALEKMGAAMVRTPVGDRHVVECMRSKGYNFGGEQSGHLVFLDHITTGDGTLAGLQLLSVMEKTQKPLSQLATVMESYPQILRNVRLRAPMALEAIPGLAKRIEQEERRLGDTGRVLVRPSGTEPLIRVMVEGECEKTITEIAAGLCQHIEEVQKG
ncbi:unnamed protein product [Cyprideis torosa]|uniref:Phosphoglucosamine mutase n=1 Tax=Cyprideis torosa TaxID=163714 RepID=A0A7R8ZX66_9CRUS|nr:unnamed protein product [Cyprideis torosa]CAG0906613.1 unnamed protein product [Cyprideis torosa]